MWAGVSLLLSLLLAQALGLLSGLTLVPPMRRWAWAGLHWRDWRDSTGWRLLAALLVLTVVVQALNLLVHGLVPARPPAANLFLTMVLEKSSSAWQGAMVVALVGLVLPLVEEVIFRGLLYGGLRRRTNMAVAAGVSAALFGLAHGPVAALPTAVLGAGYALAYEYGRNLLWPWLGHAASNLAVLILYLATHTGG